jgi:hypothetical protein
MSYELDTIDARLAELPATPVTDSDLDERARLMIRRCELAQAARAAPPKAAPAGTVTVFLPDSSGATHMYDIAGREFRAHDLDGRRVIDIPPAMFRHLLTGSHGQDWERANQDNRALWDRVTRSGAYAD